MAKLGNNPVACLVQSPGEGDMVELTTQLVVSRGIYKLLELAEAEDQAIGQPAISALHHLSTTNRRLMANLLRATDNASLLAAIAAGPPGWSLTAMCPSSVYRQHMHWHSSVSSSTAKIWKPVDLQWPTLESRTSSLVQKVDGAS